MRPRSVLTLLLAAGIAAAFTFSLTIALTASAGSGCEATYTVQRGDTLGQIAGRLGTTVAELLRLNRGLVRNPDLIFPGQTLCVPPTPLKKDEGAAQDGFASQVAIEVTYQFLPGEDEEGWNVLTSRGGFVGKRLVYPLQPLAPALYITQPAQMETQMLGSPGLSLLLVRDDTDSPTYKLVFVGQGPPLSASLHISDTALTHPDFTTPGGADVTEALAITGTQQVTVTIWLESEGGIRFPFAISRIAQQVDAQEAISSYNYREEIITGLALFYLPPVPAASDQTEGTYQVIVLLQNDQFGPSGNIPATNCDRWKDKRGPLYRWLRAFSRCRR